MATQILTELPSLQETGIDFDSVLSELQEIIKNNPNWNENWSAFYSSEAGQMFLQLMSFICDNLAVRQDVLLNESFLSTANKKKNKIRLLKQIGYQPNLAHSAQVPITIELNAVQEEDVIITPAFSTTSSMTLRVNNIAKISGKDINDDSTTWEILPLSNNIPDYLGEIKLTAGSTSYTSDSNDNTLYAIQGETKYTEFTSSSSDGPYVDLTDDDISADSIAVYIKSNAKKLQQVSSFVSTEAMDSSYAVPYIVSLNDDGSLRIRFANTDLLDSDRLLPAGSTISIFYRVCNGSLGNIQANFINTTSYFTTSSSEESVSAIVYNDTMAYNGTDAEELDSAVLNAPLTLRTLDRAVTVEDFDILLKANSNILKAKTYTASNNPNDFKSLYGRYINPQEAFIFALINRDYSSIPSDQYNNYPWISLYRKPRLNEKYSFESGENNVEISKSDTYYNLTIFEDEENSKTFNNATILNIGTTFNNAVLEDLDNVSFKLKIATSELDDVYFSNIPFSLMTTSESYGKMLYIDLNDNLEISVDDNAKFISSKSYDKEIENDFVISCVDIISSRYIILSLDGRTEIKIDLWENYSEGMPSDHYWVLWDNEPSGTIAEASDSKQSASFNRHGIVQLINNQLVAISSGETSQEEAANVYTSNNSYQWFGLRVSDPDNTLLTFDDNYKRKDLILTINDKIFKFPIVAEDGASSISYQDLVDQMNAHFEDSSAVRVYNENYWIQNIYDLSTLKADIVQTTNYVDGDYSYSYDIFIKTEDTSWLENNKINISYNVVSAIMTSGDENIYKDIAYNEYYGYSSFIHTVHGLNDTTVNYTTLLGASFEAVDYSNLAKMLEDPSDETKEYFCIESPISGSQSSIQFMCDDVYEEGYGNFMRDFLGVYFNSQKASQRAYGQKKLKLLKSISEVGYKTDITDSDYTSLSSLTTGNLIFENSCIYNSYDFSTLYAFYKLADTTSLVIGSVYDNFYYSGDSETDENMKDDVVYLTGTAFDESGKVDELNSDYELKLTKSSVDTNSYYAIEDDLGVIPCDKVAISSANISEEFPDSTLSFTFDSISSSYIIDVNLSGLKNGPEVVNAIKNEIKACELYDDEDNNIYEDYIENIDKVVYTSYDCLNQVNLRGLSKQNGNVTFYYPGRFSLDNIKKMFQLFFGTSNTNSEFYTLYPIDMFSEEDIVGLDSNGEFIDPTYDEDGNITCEYFYYPAEGYPLVFTYRKLVSGVSRAGDYYITYNETSEKYLLVRTENSVFPSSNFYMHFINDRSSLEDFECDEKTINEYMNDKKISGMELYLAQPYFRGYDIKATVYYNANYSEAAIKSTVEEAIETLCNVENAEIGGYMSQAKIIKEIMTCDGVENVVIDYFGYDYALGSSVNQLDAAFYEILHINDYEENKHGILFDYEVQS